MLLSSSFEYISLTCITLAKQLSLHESHSVV